MLQYICLKLLKINVCPSLQSDLDLQIREHSYSTKGNWYVRGAVSMHGMH